MPRNSSGGYTLPVGNPVVSGTVILSTWANPTMSDIAAALTDSLDRNGRGSMLAPFLVVDGTIGGPGLAFASQSNVGLFRSASNVLSITSGGIEAAKFSDAAITFLHPVTAPDLTVSGTLNTSGTLNVSGTITAAAVNVSGGMTSNTLAVTGAMWAGSLSNATVHLPDGATAAPSLCFTNAPTRGMYHTGSGPGLCADGRLMFQVTGGAVYHYGPCFMPPGAAAQPAIAFEQNPNTGFYQPAPGYLAVVCNGVEVQRWGGPFVPGVPIGTIVDFAGPNIPAGWFLCDGSAVGRADYPQLFAAISTYWGVGNGSTTFNLPNLVNRTTVGYGLQGVGTLDGIEYLAISVANLPPHNHPVGDPGHAHGVNDPGHGHSVPSGGANQGNGAFADASLRNTTFTGSAATGITIAAAGTGISIGNTGSGTPIRTMQPYGVVLKIIRAV